MDRWHAGGREPLEGSLEGHVVVVAKHCGPQDAPAKKKRDPNAKKVRFRYYCPNAKKVRFRYYCSE